MEQLANCSGLMAERMNIGKPLYPTPRLWASPQPFAPDRSRCGWCCCTYRSNSYQICKPSLLLSTLPNSEPHSS